MDRRTFVTAAMSAASYSRVLGANDRIGVAIIGAGGQGRGDWGRFLKQPDVHPVAVCDVYKPHIEKAQQMAGGKAKTFGDFRKLLEVKEADAVIVATPDHWHAIPTILACQAGKDVYVEKPLSLTIKEAQMMLKAARKYNRVVQTGSQQRSGEHYARAVEIIRNAAIRDPLSLIVNRSPAKATFGRRSISLSRYGICSTPESRRGSSAPSSDASSTTEKSAR